jgi:hypothetical protein
MRAYISGPMSGMPEYNRVAFEEAAIRLRDIGYEVTSPIELDNADGHSMDDPNLMDYYWYFLSRDIQVIGDSKIDEMFVLEGWWKSRGARLEIFQALLLKIPVKSANTLRTYSTAGILEILTSSITGE